MSTSQSTRASSGTRNRESCSTRSPQSVDEFAAIQRRLLVAISQVRLTVQALGDFSDLTKEQAPGGIVLSEAADDLDEIYNDLDGWHAHGRKEAQQS
jgi:hypothetical protein